MMNELRECPFCGGEADFYFRRLEGVGTVVRVCCSECLAKVTFLMTSLTL